VHVDLRGYGIFIDSSDVLAWRGERFHYPLFGGKWRGGRVSAVGANVQGLQEGDLVAVPPEGHDGTFTSDVVTDARLCIKIEDGVEPGLIGMLASAQLGWWDALSQYKVPKGVPPQLAAMLLSADTPRRPVVATLGSDELAMAYTIVAADSAERRFAIGREQKALDLICALGASESFNTGNLSSTDLRVGLRRATDGSGVDVLVATLADDSVLVGAHEFVAEGGVLVIAGRHVGARGGQRTVPMGTWNGHALKLDNAHGYGPTERRAAFMDVMARSRAGEVDASGMVAETAFALIDVDAAFKEAERTAGAVKVTP
jgi:threonine dehydrogenase-like Zn-dependent dehydrogenase